MTKTLTAILHQEGNLYVAECSETGTASQGETIEEALTSLKEATELYLEEFPQQTTSHPIMPRQTLSADVGSS